ncbi:MAG: cupin domain-containing protein [Methylophilus sp.]|jgi:hypothetical protein
MSRVIVEKPSAEQLKSLGVDRWPIWTKEVSTFPWTYSSKEVAYILEGEVTVTSKTGEAVSFGVGDLVTFETGLECTWQVKKPLKKHYNFE